jgi:hypothetical protein
MGKDFKAAKKGKHAYTNTNKQTAVSKATDEAVMHSFWDPSFYNSFIGIVIIMGMGMEHVFAFGDNVESYNWGLLVLLVASQIIWTWTKMLEAILPVLNTSRKGDSFHFGLALRLFVVAGVIMASSTLWTFSSSDIRSLGPVMVGFVCIVLCIIWISQKSHSTPLATGLPYLAELVLAFYGVGLVPQLFPAHNNMLADVGNAWMGTFVIMQLVGTLLGLQAVSRLRNMGLRRSFLPWILAWHTIAVVIICLWGLCGNLVARNARIAHTVLMLLAICIYALVYQSLRSTQQVMSFESNKKPKKQ